MSRSERSVGELNRLSGQVVLSAIAVHAALGPGLLEGAYEACLARELRLRGVRVETQVALPVMYRGERVDVGYRLDLLVSRSIVVEVKAIAKLLPIHHAQLLSYLRLSGLRLGLLVNFHVPQLRDGIKRMANGL